MSSHTSSRPGIEGTPAAGRAPQRLVTDAPTRMFHWLFAASFAGAWLTAESERWRLVHVSLGYLFAALLGFRLIYGLMGPRRVRLGVLWCKVSGLPGWVSRLRAVRSISGIEFRQGLNLLAGSTILAMLLLVVPLTLTGHGTYEDWGASLFGGDWLEDVHELFANAFLSAIALHLGLLVVQSLLRGQNQALPMLTGRIPGSGPSPVKKELTWLALLLALAAVTLFVGLMTSV